MFICPVCKSRDITVYGENSTAKCTQCGTFDALHKFEAAIIYTNPGERVPEAIFPPQRVIDAVDVLHEYFTGERGAKQWAFGHVQSAEAPALVGIEHIRNMARAFQMELLTRPKHADLIERMRGWLKTADEQAREANEPVTAQADYVAHQIDNYFFPMDIL